ncbi:MAG: 6-carboxytetrahydropterin synthase QueD [Deltaproteobacteria bacterium]|nr:6-carboxytetrahydropterin synthase QueD [Deltaproteobacteria bacterium]
MLLTREFRFHSSHQIPNHDGLCQNLHGHSYLLYVTVKGRVNPETGMVLDFDDLDGIVRGRVLVKLDHNFLNNHIPLPSCENIAMWIWNQIRPDLPGLFEVKLYETHDSYVTYRGGEDERAA